MAKKKDVSDEEEIPASFIMADLERLSRLLRQASQSEGLIPVQWEALRYLARANRLSRSLRALTKYLGATKGTISQTVQGLEKKGLLIRLPEAERERYVSLQLTDAARLLLASDPLAAIAADIDELGGKTRRRLARGLSELLAKKALRRNVPQFGSCPACRYFREGGTDRQAQCMKDGGNLAKNELTLLCIEYTAR